MTAMEGANPHLSAGTDHAGADPGRATLVVVAVHGRDHSPAYMREHLVDRVLARTGRDDVAWILPAAHEGSWYPNGFLAPVADNQPWLDHALEVMSTIDQSLAHREPASVLWCGFSQGACLVTEHLARHPTVGGRRRGGLAALTGAMIGSTDHPLVVRGRFDGMPAYFGVGDPDDWVPTWRVHESADAYRDAGAEVTVDVFPERPHEISGAEIDRIVTLIDHMAPV